jgi:hypothetical protein
MGRWVLVLRCWVVAIFGMPCHSSFLGEEAARLGTPSGFFCLTGDQMKEFINSKYIASMEYTKGEKEFSKDIPFSKILLFLPKRIASNLKLGDTLSTILPVRHKIVSFKIIELAILNSSPSHVRFNGKNPTLFIKVKGELKPWKKQPKKQLSS